MYKFIRSLTILAALFLELNALELDAKYPHYKYVFNEFDVENTYIYDKTFQDFTLENEDALRGFYKRSLKRGKELLPTMKGILADKGVSDLFIYLSMIESGFLSNAVSSKKAVGLWQFMPATAKQYDLSVCKTYDERCDTSSATSAAIRYLNKLYKDFGKWYLAAMAYNCGEGCLQKAIKRAGSDALHILTDEKARYVPKETRDYIKKILLIAMIGESTKLDYAYTSSENEWVNVKVNAGTSLKALATKLKMSYGILKKMNPKIKSHFVPKNNKNLQYTIQIPLEKIFSFYLQYELDKEKEMIKPHLISHYVGLGETLKSIAKKYKTSSIEIKNANNLDTDYLTLEQLLVVPVSQKTFEQTLLGTSK